MSARSSKKQASRAAAAAQPDEDMKQAKPDADGAIVADSASGAAIQTPAHSFKIKVLKGCVSVTVTLHRIPEQYESSRNPNCFSLLFTCPWPLVGTSIMSPQKLSSISTP
jgi:hypothetical protein